jgi:hypothetical protein
VIKAHARPKASFEVMGVKEVIALMFIRFLSLLRLVPTGWRRYTVIAKRRSNFAGAAREGDAGSVQSMRAENSDLMAAASRRYFLNVRM